MSICPSHLRIMALALLLPALAGCEQLVAQLGLPDPKKEAAAAEAEGKAIGGACRHSGQALADCYAMNPAAAKASIFAGWREMNDYMTQNNMEVVPSHIPTAGLMLPHPKTEAPKVDGHAEAAPNTESPKVDGHAEAAPNTESPKDEGEAPPRRRLRRSAQS